MVDHVDSVRRSAIMASVHSKDTRPELIVRRTIHALGYRFRLHKRDLPGKPDLVLARHRLAVFVHGCFWHRHPGCSKASLPKTHQDYWREKFAANRERDERVYAELTTAGWRVEVVWQCETRDKARLRQRLAETIGRYTKP
ncbi:DNA mismatch endonuclease Vsr [Mesorhizobium sp. CA10]|uniref:very short patch repair endonuclease n=1 Tax=Mesorhizobium sp. CA10 TaxID=588495 RepID=UPI001CCC5E04|nr:DNA mismatch endonuclease Vsr [Mesorhizobium sp. CA10]MBZ9883491.1 DNA mismatch endonuclease Vsr [Mesorhizobium sp. CA10]